MLSLSLAQKLKEAGLTWQPAKLDAFAIPDRGLDEHIFVINFMLVGVGMVHGRPVVTFHGTVESPLDYLYLSEAVWLPTEEQLRTVLEKELVATALPAEAVTADQEPQPALNLTSTPDGYHCQIQFRNQSLSFEGFGVAEVYGMALLHVLENQ